MIKTSKFMQAYMKIIKESADDSQVPETTPEVPEVKPDEAAAPVDAKKQICFKTADAALADALSKGFEEVVFFVKDVDADGKDTVTEVKFKGDVFEDLVVTDVPAEDPEKGDETVAECGDPTITEGDEKECPECGKNPCECEPCPDCGKKPCECEK